LTIVSSHTNGASVNYQYNGDNLVQKVTDNRIAAQGSSNGVTTDNYDNFNDLSTYTLPNGVQTNRKRPVVTVSTSS